MHPTPYPHPAHTTIPTLSPPRTPHHYPHPACSPLNLPSRTKLCVIRSILKFSARFHETKSVRRFILAQFLFNIPVNNFSVILGQSYRFLGIYQYFGNLKVSCSRTLYGGRGIRRSWGSNPGPLAPELYHLATAVPIRYM